MKPLSEVRNDTRARVLEIQSGSLAPRLVEMGFCKGREVRVLYRAPFDGPLAVYLGASSVALRLNEAELVWVEEIIGEEA
jgi:Fe2+ transport system protein FeoA